MFLLRCVFWLSIVYASMSWGGEALSHHASFQTATLQEGDMLQTVTTRAVEGAASFCRDHGPECLKDAARLTALVQTTLQSEDGDDSIVQEDPDAPMPIPDPRRRVASAMLTRLP